MLYLVIGFICALLGFLIGKEKGQGGFGALLGLLLGPIGLLIILVMAGNKIKCPYCQEKIHIDATKCPYCQSMIASDGNDSRFQHGYFKKKSK
jgi:hypothetical protein